MDSEQTAGRRRLDFGEINDGLLIRSASVLAEWFPAGKIKGNEFTIGNLRGDAGRSLSVNTQTGAWADFATGESGGDLISLFAAIHGIGQGDAAKRLSGRPDKNPNDGRKNNEVSKARHQVSRPAKFTPSIPPENQTPEILGQPEAVHVYRQADGRSLFYIARIIGTNGKKIFTPYSWDGTAWVKKAWPTDRPLYGLELLNSRPILIVEGEKCADILRKISRHYTVVSWSGGSNAVDKTDWTPLHDRHILIWPDADEPGKNAASKIGFLLYGKTKSLKILNITGRPDGWDAADAVKDGWDWERILEWAKPLAINYEPPKKAEPVPDDEANTASLRDGHSIETLWEYLGLARMKSGAVHCNTDNVIRALEGLREFRSFIWYDEFHNKYFTKLHGGVQEWKDDDDLTLMVLVQNKLGLTKISDRNINQAVRYLGRKDIRNEPRDWMQSLEWDSVNRLDQFFIECFGAEDSEYSKAAARNWFIGMIARVFTPGCKVDNMVIFEGGQGKRKSTAISIIGDPWYTEVTESVMSKDFYMSIQGRLIVEVGELDAFNRAESNTIKKVITCREDRFRPPYGRATESFPRKCIFVGSTNEESYLRDDTGGRRFWPIRCGEINIEKIRETREQVFAEAVHRYKSGESWWAMPETAANEQEVRRESDPWEEIVQDWLFVNQKTRVRIDEVATDCLKVDVDKLDKKIKARVMNILKVLRWKSVIVWDGGKSVRRWIKPDSFEAQVNLDPPWPGLETMPAESDADDFD